MLGTQGHNLSFKTFPQIRARLCLIPIVGLFTSLRTALAIMEIHLAVRRLLGTIATKGLVKHINMLIHGLFEAFALKHACRFNHLHLRTVFLLVESLASYSFTLALWVFFGLRTVDIRLEVLAACIGCDVARIEARLVDFGRIVANDALGIIILCLSDRDSLRDYLPVWYL